MMSVCSLPPRQPPSAPCPPRPLRSAGPSGERGSTLQAYRSLRIGAQRADLLRMLLCKYEGCVYADLDTELLRPLREVIPANASAVASAVWPLDMLVYEAAHPIVTHVVALQTHHILEQVKLHCRRDPTQCRTPYSCVMSVTGPDVYLNAIYQVTRLQNCSNKVQRVGVGECANATDEAFRQTHMCTQQVEEAGKPLLLCNAFRHHDCRTNGRSCPSGHWQQRSRPSSHYFVGGEVVDRQCEAASETVAYGFSLSLSSLSLS